MLPYDAPVVLILPEPVEESLTEAGADELCEAQRRGESPVVLDVRQELDWGWGTIPVSHLIFVSDLPARLVGNGGVGEWRARCRTRQNAAA